MAVDPSEQGSAGVAASDEIVPEIEKQIEEQLPRQFRDLPEEVRRDVLSKVSGATVTISHATWDGAYPPPSILEGYESIQPGLADRIFTMAEEELSHRHDMERKAASYMSRGQWFGFILAAIALSGGMFLVYNGEHLAGGIIGASIIIPLVTLFIHGQLSSSGAPTDKPAPAKQKSQRKRKTAGSK